MKGPNIVCVCVEKTQHVQGIFSCFSLLDCVSFSTGILLLRKVKEYLIVCIENVDIVSVNKEEDSVHDEAVWS